MEKLVVDGRAICSVEDVLRAVRNPEESPDGVDVPLDAHFSPECWGWKYDSYFRFWSYEVRPGTETFSCQSRNLKKVGKFEYTTSPSESPFAVYWVLGVLRDVAAESGVQCPM